MVGNYFGNLYIVAAPSGGGKTSLVRKLIETLDDIEVSISHTTRAMRPGEKNGVDYFFVNEDDFIAMVNDNAFIEHARVFNNLYGTSAAQIIKRLQNGIDIVLDIDWQGAEQIRRSFPNAVGIFIIPPSLDVLKERLMNRRQDKNEVISDRMKKALELRAIVIANRLKIEAQVNKQSKLLSFLLSSQ
jgi:guanylate kinase